MGSFEYGAGARRWYQRPKAIALGLVVGVLAATTFAVAAWLASGNGNGYAKAGSEQALTTLDASASVSVRLFPNSTGDLAITVHNVNGPLTLTSIQSSGATTASGGIGTCTTTGVTLVQATVDAFVGAGKPLPSGDSTFVIANGAAMSNASETGCQNATFALPVSLQATT